MNEHKIKHDYSFDILRIIACFLVIVNHTNSEVFLSMEPCLTWYLSVGYFYLSKIAVPIFIMISGALLFKREYTYKEILVNKVGKTLAVILIFSLYIYLVVEGNKLDIRLFFERIIESPIIVSYWYLYLLLGMYLVLPFLSKIIKAMKENDWKYFFVIWFFFSGVLPILVRYEIIPTVTFWFDIQIMSDYIGYLFMGYYLSKMKPSKSLIKRMSLIAFIVVPSIILISTGSAYYEYQTWSQLYLMLDNVYYATTMISSILVFFVLHHTLKNKNFNSTVALILTKISSTTFGIYVLHNIYITQFNYVRYDLLYFNNQLVSVILFEVFLFLFCSLVTGCLKKVPVFKQIL